MHPASDSGSMSDKHEHSAVRGMVQGLPFFRQGLAKRGSNLSANTVLLILLVTLFLSLIVSRRAPCPSDGTPPAAAGKPADAAATAEGVGVSAQSDAGLHQKDSSPADKGEDARIAALYDVPLVKGPFVYVYELGSNYTDDIDRLQPSWYSRIYDVEKELTQLLLASTGTVRTMDPLKASLFFIPVYSARFTLYHFKDWEVNMDEAVRRTSELWTEVLGRVQREFPYFNRKRGRDHFGILTMDHGRCTALTFVDPSLYGDMFFVTYNGDKMVRSDNADPKRNMQAIAYTYGEARHQGMPSIPCYMAGRDILVPPLLELPLVAPDASARQIAVALRFSREQHHRVSIRHHGHDIRREVIDRYESKDLPGWSFEVKDLTASNRDWGSTVLCVCPPGHSQWTTRPFKCLVSGAIPVTFFRAHDNPFDHILDYSAFSINIDPDAVSHLKEVLDNVLYKPGLLESLQEGVSRVQKFFLWTNSWEGGAELLLLHELRRRASQLHLTPSH